MTNALPGPLHSIAPSRQFLSVPAGAENNFTAAALAARTMSLALLPPQIRFLCYEVEAKVYPWAVKHVAQAFVGNVAAATSLCAAIDNDQRGLVAVMFWKAKIPVLAYRAFLESAWTDSHAEVIKAATTTRRLRAMFKYAAFDTSNQPDTVRVWRGTWGIDARTAARGFSWTTDRDLACWFAMRFSQPSPLVLMAEVRREMIACYTSDRGENEIVLFTPPAAIIDGTEAEWTERFLAAQSRKEKESARLLELV